MKSTLYEKLIYAEGINEELMTSVNEFCQGLERFSNLPGYFEIFLGEIPEINTFQCQRNLMKEYEENPVFGDAIHGKTSIEKSLQDLAQVNHGIKKIFPRRKNKVHNKRLEQIGELITNPHHLKTNLDADNLVGGMALVGIAVYGTANLFIPYVLGGPNLPWIIPTFVTLAVGSAMGLSGQSKRTGNLPINEAEYLDKKIQEFYK